MNSCFTLVRFTPGVNQHFTQSQPPVDNMLPDLMVEDSFNMVPASPASVKAVAQQGPKPEPILNHMDESIDQVLTAFGLPHVLIDETGVLTSVEIRNIISGMRTCSYTGTDFSIE